MTLHILIAGNIKPIVVLECEASCGQINVVRPELCQHFSTKSSQAHMHTFVGVLYYLCGACLCPNPLHALFLNCIHLEGMLWQM